MIEDQVTIKHLVDFSGDIYCDTTYTNEVNNNTDEINPTFDSNKSDDITSYDYFESSPILNEEEAICNNCLLNIFQTHDYDSDDVNDFIKEISEDKFKKETITRALQKTNDSYEESNGNIPYDLKQKFTPTEIYNIRNDIENNPDYPPQVIRGNKEPTGDQVGFFLSQVFSEDRKNEEELDKEEHIIYEDIYYGNVRLYYYYMTLRFFRFPLSSDYTGGKLSYFEDDEGFISNRLLHYDYFEDDPERSFAPQTKVSVRTNPIKYLYISDKPFFDYKIDYPEQIHKWPKKAQKEFTEINFSDSYIHIQKYSNNKDVYSYCGYPSKFLSMDGQYIVHPYYLSKDGEALTENPKIPKNKLCPLCESEFPETIDERQPSLRK